MINTIRRVLLLVAFCFIGVAGFYLFQNLNTTVELGDIKLKVMKKGINVEIENFKVIHEVKGVKEWELKADLAQINNQKNLTELRNVQMIIHKGYNKKHTIYADSGTYKKTTNDVNLAGNVKFIGSSEILQEHLSITSSKSIQNK